MRVALNLEGKIKMFIAFTSKGVLPRFRFENSLSLSVSFSSQPTTPYLTLRLPPRKGKHT